MQEHYIHNTTKKINLLTAYNVDFIINHYSWCTDVLHCPVFHPIPQIPSYVVHLSRTNISYHCKII